MLQHRAPFSVTQQNQTLHHQRLLCNQNRIRITSIKWLEAFLFPPGWNASPSQDGQIHHFISCPTQFQFLNLLAVRISLLLFTLPNITQQGVLLFPLGWGACPAQDNQHPPTPPPSRDASLSQDTNHKATSIITFPTLEYYYSPSMGFPSRVLLSQPWMGC